MRRKVRGHSHRQYSRAQGPRPVLLLSGVAVPLSLVARLIKDYLCPHFCSEFASIANRSSCVQAEQCPRCRCRPQCNNVYLLCNPDVQEEEGSEGGVCECLSSYHEQADRTCVPPLAPALPRVAAGEEVAGAGAAGSVIAAVICVLALAVLSVLGVLFVR